MRTVNEIVCTMQTANATCNSIIHSSRVYGEYLRYCEFIGHIVGAVRYRAFTFRSAFTNFTWSKYQFQAYTEKKSHESFASANHCLHWHKQTLRFERASKRMLHECIHAYDIGESSPCRSDVPFSRELMPSICGTKTSCDTLLDEHMRDIRTIAMCWRNHVLLLRFEFSMASEI